MPNDNEFKNFLIQHRRRTTGGNQRGPLGLAKKAGKETKFETANLPIFDQMLQVLENDIRYVLLKNAAGMKVRGQGDIRVNELTNSSYDQKYKIFTALKKEGDYGLRNLSSFNRLHRFSTHLLTADKNTRIFGVTGKKVTNKKTGGLGWVKVFDGREQVQFLLVKTIQTLQVPVQVFSVSHLVNNKQIAHSDIGKERVNEAVGYVNVILRQAGIEITLKSWGSAEVKEKYPDLINMRDYNNDWVKGISATKQTLQGIKVYIVKDLVNALNTRAFYRPDTSEIYIGIKGFPGEKFGRVFAHELCHAFGFHGHVKETNSLMSEVPGDAIGLDFHLIDIIRSGLVKMHYDK